MIQSDLRVFSAHHLIKALSIPDKYLRQLLTTLSKAGFIKSIRGREGGYVLARNPDKIRLSDIIEVIDGMERYERCLLGFPSCSDDNPCSLHRKWAPLREQMLHFLRETTLDEIRQNDITKF